MVVKIPHGKYYLWYNTGNDINSFLEGLERSDADDEGLYVIEPVKSWLAERNAVYTLGPDLIDFQSDDIAMEFKLRWL
jgi:hypothetical protein